MWPIAICSAIYPVLAWRSCLPIPAEFSRLLALDSVPPTGTTVHLKASADECRALAARFELVRLDRLEGELTVAPVDPTSMFHVTGHVDADAVQSCVVTFEPVPARVRASFDRLFSREVPADTDAEVEIDVDAETPEPLTGDKLDLGEILAEELSLALDPYPRSPEADRRLAQLAAEGGDNPGGPFDALAAWRKH